MADLVAGRYELQSKLGEGSVAEVYRALDRELNRPVAIKFLRAEAQERDVVRQRFVREARAIAKVSHPNLITVHDAGETDDGRMFIVMELVEGRTLDYFMKERAIAPKEAADIVRRVALGLQHAHEAGIIHRDLKPANILITPSGEPKVVDFGLARLREGDSLMTKPGMIVGTPRYMAPEQVRGGGGLLTPATDVYALGAILHEMLARRPLHAGESTFDVINSVLNDEAIPVRQFNPDVPAALEAVILKSIEKSAGLRYPSAVAFSQDLERFLVDAPVLARRPSRMTKLRKTASRHVVVLASAAALVMLGIVAVAILRSAPMRTPPPASAEMWRAYVDSGNRLLEQIVAKKRENGYERADIKALAERAVLEYSKALAERPNDPAALVGQGRASALAGERQKALDAFAKAISAAPALPAAYIERVRLIVEQYGELRHGGGDDPGMKASIDADLAKLGDLAKDAPDGTYARGLLAFASTEYESAATLLEQYLVSADWDGAAHYWRGDALLRLRRPREAIASLTLALRADTGLLAAWICRADARADDGDLAGAIGDYTEALRLDPQSADVLARRGRLHADLKNWDAALADCADALKLAPDNCNLLMDRGFVLERKGDLDGAIDDYTKAAERGDRRGDAYYRRALVLRRKRDDEAALRDFDAALRHVPQHAEALVSRGNLHLDRKDPRAALADYNAAIALKPAYASAYHGRGRARRLMGEIRAAVDDFTQCLACEPRFWQALNQRALLKRELGDAAGAIEDLAAALRINPDDPDLLVNLGNARRSGKDSRGAIEAYDRALSVDPAVLNAHFNRGLARMDLEQWDGAIEDLSEAMRRQGPHADAFASRGLAKLGRGDKAGAVEDLQEALRIAPTGWRHLEPIRHKLRELGPEKK